MLFLTNLSYLDDSLVPSLLSHAPREKSLVTRLLNSCSMDDGVALLVFDVFQLIHACMHDLYYDDVKIILQSDFWCVIKTLLLIAAICVICSAIASPAHKNSSIRLASCC